jgi:nickel-dependent lactate racemase
MDINEQILNELKQMNITLSKLASIIASGSTQALPARQSTKDLGADIEERIRKARQEAEAKIGKLKSGLPGI